MPQLRPFQETEPPTTYEDKYFCNIGKYSHILVEHSSKLSENLKRATFFESEKIIFKKYHTATTVFPGNGATNYV